MNAEELRQENLALRQGLSLVAANLGNGSAASPQASIYFLTEALPREVKLYCEALRREKNCDPHGRPYPPAQSFKSTHAPMSATTDRGEIIVQSGTADENRPAIGVLFIHRETQSERAFMLSPSVACSLIALLNAAVTQSSPPAHPSPLTPHPSHP